MFLCILLTIYSYTPIEMVTLNGLTPSHGVWQHTNNYCYQERL